MTKRNVYLLTAVLGATLIAPVAAQTQVPFNGTLQGNDTDQGAPSPTTLWVATSGTGISTLLGQFSFTQENLVDFVSFTDGGSARFVAASGDSIETTFTGSGEPTDRPDVVRITEVHVIAGGTGRFAHANGSFVVNRLANTATFLTSGSFHGTSTSPAAAH